MRLTDPLVLIPVAVFLGVLVGSLGLIFFLRFRAERKRLVGKIRESGFESFPYGVPEDGTLTTEKKGVLARVLEKALAPIGRKIAPRKDEHVTELRKSFLRAGYRGDYMIPIYFGAKIACAVLLATLYHFLNSYYLHITSFNYNIALTVLLAVFGYSIPAFWLSFKTAKRKKKIFEGLPDALDMMVVCVEAGMGLDAAIHRVSEEISLEHKVISDEFKLVGLELRAGKMRRDALRSLAMRCDHEDVSSLVALLIQTDKFGTSVAQALKVHADAMRTKRFQLAEELAMKIPVKLVFPLVLFILPSLFVVVVGPAAITIYRNIVSR